MKKAEAISILATSVRPREPKDRARYDEAVKMAIEALKSSEQTIESAQNVQDEDLISKLSEIRSEYNCIDEDGEPQYRALSEAIRILSQLADGDTISRQAAIDALDKRFDDVPMELTTEILQLRRDLRERIPSAQPATNCSEIPNGSDDTISRRAAIDALDEQIEQCNKALCSFDISPKDEYAIKVERASLEAYKEQLENMPSAQPDRDVIDDCLYHIYKNISVHTATGGVITIRYYMEKLYEEIYGEGEKPWWMT